VADALWRNDATRQRKDRGDEAMTPPTDLQTRADEALRVVRKALIEERPLCDECDGCGWYEGGPSLQTQCERCLGDGHADAPEVFAALAFLSTVTLVAVEKGEPPFGMPVEIYFDPSGPTGTDEWFDSLPSAGNIVYRFVGIAIREGEGP